MREALDSFVESDLKIVAQIYLDISGAKADFEGASGKDSESLFKKDQALAQCRNCWIDTCRMRQRIDAPSTSSAVQVITNTFGAAAIAGEHAAQFYGMPVVERNIQDKADNTTRFFVLGKKPGGRVGGGQHISSFLICSATRRPRIRAHCSRCCSRWRSGASIFQKSNRARARSACVDYYFFIDVTGHHDDASMKAAAPAELKKFCTLVKWLEAIRA